MSRPQYIRCDVCGDEKRVTMVSVSTESRTAWGATQAPRWKAEVEGPGRGVALFFFDVRINEHAFDVCGTCIEKLGLGKLVEKV